MFCEVITITRVCCFNFGWVIEYNYKKTSISTSIRQYFTVRRILFLTQFCPSNSTAGFYADLGFTNDSLTILMNLP